MEPTGILAIGMAGLRANCVAGHVLVQSTEEDCELADSTAFLATRAAEDGAMSQPHGSRWWMKAAALATAAVGLVGVGSGYVTSPGSRTSRASHAGGLTGLFDNSPEAIAAALAKAEERGVLEDVLEANTKTLAVPAQVGGEDAQVFLFLNCGDGATECGANIKVLDNGFEISGGSTAFRQMLIMPRAPLFDADTKLLDYTSLRSWQLGKGSAVAVKMDKSQAGDCMVLFGDMDGSAESACNPLSHSADEENLCEGTGFAFVKGHSRITEHSDTSKPVDEKTHKEALDLYSDVEGDSKAITVLSITDGRHFKEETLQEDVVQEHDTKQLKDAGPAADTELFVDMFAEQDVVFESKDGEAATNMVSSNKGCTASQKVTFTDLTITMTPPVAAE